MKNKRIVGLLTISFLLLFAGIAFGQMNQKIPGMAKQTNIYTVTNGASIGNIAQSTTINENITISSPIREEEKVTATNIAINFTANIGIINPTVVDVKRDEDDARNLNVKVKDKDSGEIIIIIITPEKQVQEKVQNTQRFTETENNFNGNHVSFQFTNDTILNYTLDNKLIFQSINLGFTATKTTRIGSELRISDNNNMVIVHDDANGILTESSSENIIALYTPAIDIKSKITGKRVDLTNNIVASILSSDPDSNEVVPTKTGDVINIAINRGRSTLIVKSPSGGDFDDRVVRGIAEKKVGNIINIDTDDSRDVTTFDVDTTINNVVQNTININVTSEATSGRVIALRANNNVLKDLNLRVLVDGDDIQKAKDLDDLFKVDKLSSLIIIGQNIEVLISIPKFSEHNIVITSAAAPISTTTGMTTTTSPVPISSPTAVSTSPSKTPGAPGFTVGLVLIALVIVVLMRRRK